MGYFDVEAVAAVNRLSAPGKAGFAYAVCARMQPHYGAFAEAEGWGDPAALQAALTTLYGAVFAPAAAQEVQRTTAAVEAATPDSDDFGSVLGALAQDACGALLSALDWLLHAEEQRLVEVLTFAHNTVDLYVQEVLALEPNDPALEQQIAEAPAMRREIEWHRTALALLQGMPRPTEALLQELIQGNMLELEQLPAY